MVQLDQYTQYTEMAKTHLMNALMSYGPKLLLALLTLVVGMKLIGTLVRLLDRSLEKREFDATLRPFLLSLLSIGAKALLLISVASMVGIATTSFVAVLGAAGLAVGLALQGSLANFAGGVLIMFFKPYRVGDYIEAQGHAGTVKEIQIFCTILTTPDNRRIIIPNGPLAGGSMINYSAEENRRVDFNFGIAYKDDVLKAKQILRDLIAADERVLPEPETFIAVSQLADNSVNIVMRAWVKKENYWPLFHDVMEKVKVTFDKEGISFPFPQRDIYLHHIKAGTENSLQ